MGRDALLAAVLSGVLRPGTSSEQSLGFGRSPVSEVDLREGFGENVARLVAGVEHVTCVEETAHSILRGRDRGFSSGGGGAKAGGRSSSAKAFAAHGLSESEEGRGEDEEEEEGYGGLSPEVLSGAGGRTGGGSGGGGGGGGAKGGRLREASALEQVSRRQTRAVDLCAHFLSLVVVIFIFWKLYRLDNFDRPVGRPFIFFISCTTRHPIFFLASSHTLHLVMLPSEGEPCRLLFGLALLGQNG